MPIPQFTLPVVGAPYGNKDGSNREFELRLCQRGERVTLLPEPRNKYDEHAVAVLSGRGVQIGYISSERAPQIGVLQRAGHTIEAAFQEKTTWGCLVRVAVDEPPVLPPPSSRPPPATSVDGADPDFEFEPDYIPPEE